MKLCNIEQRSINQHNKDRIEFIDILKGALIVLVILGHIIQYCSGASYQEGLFFDNIIFKLIYSFHMPLFAAISGYLFYLAKEKSCVEVIKKIFFSLIIPIFSISLVDSLGRYLNGSWTLLGGIKDFLLIMNSKLWFLAAMAYCMFLTYFFAKVLNNVIVPSIVLCVISLLIPNLYHLELYNFVFPYFVIGYLINKYSLSQRYYSYVFFICLLALFLVLIFFYNYECYIYTSGLCIINSPNKQILIDIFRWLIGLSGCGSIICIIYFLYSKKSTILIWRGLVFLGRISIGLYVFNDYLMLIYKTCFPSLLIPNLFCWIVATSFILITGSIMTMVVKRIIPLNIMFLGGRS